MLQRRTRDFAGTYRTAQHGEQLENVVSGLTHAAKRTARENLLVTMHVGHLEVMSNVAGAVPLFVHRSGDAKSSSVGQTTRTSAEPQHCAMSRQTLRAQRCIVDQFYLDSALADDTTTAILCATTAKSRRRNSGMIGGETHDCTSHALDSSIMRKRAAVGVSGEPNAARGEKSVTATLSLLWLGNFAWMFNSTNAMISKRIWSATRQCDTALVVKR
jgi:hypothetical protein